MTKVCSDVEALAERCEKATGPDRELNADILEAIGDKRWRDLEYEASLPCGAPPDMIRKEARYKAGIRFDFTGSLDAAITLVPEGCLVAITNCDADGQKPDFSKASAIVAHHPDDVAYPTIAATPALALCAAALRAQSQGKL